MAIAVTSAVSATTGTALLGSTSRPAASSRNAISLWATSTSLNRAFGLKTSHPRVTCLQSETFTVKFIKEAGYWPLSKPQEVVAEVGKEEFLFDAARKKGLTSKETKVCRQPRERVGCKKCQGKIRKGDPNPLKWGLTLPEGIILTCRTYAKSDMVIDITGI